MKTRRDALVTDARWRKADIENYVIRARRWRKGEMRDRCSGASSDLCKLAKVHREDNMIKAE